MVKPAARFKDVVSESDMAGFSDVIVVAYWPVLTMLLDIKRCTSFYLEEKMSRSATPEGEKCVDQTGQQSTKKKPRLTDTFLMCAST